MLGAFGAVSPIKDPKASIHTQIRYANFNLPRCNIYCYGEYSRGHRKAVGR